MEHGKRAISAGHLCWGALGVVVLGAVGCDPTAAPDMSEAAHTDASGIAGGIDGVVGDNVIQGWACAVGQTQPIAVHLYLGGPAAGGGVFVAGGMANLPSEPAVAAACHTNGTAYRYQFTLTSAQRLQYAGKAVYVHAISPLGQGNPTLAQSGVYSIPVTLTTPVSRASVDWFVPNQFSGSPWNPMNGHIEGSFSNLGLWPNLEHVLASNAGGLGMYAAEVDHTSDASLLGFRQAGMAVSVETPAWTQCADGAALANLELNGQSPPGQNLFCSVFKICTPSGVDPNGRGWFVTSEGHPYAPEEIILDERMPGLLPSYDTTKLFDSSLTWAQRTSGIIDYCPTTAVFNPNVDRITGFVGDYIEYAQAMKAKFPTTNLSFHWNVHPWWEWTDFDCLAGVNQRHPDEAGFEHAYRYLTETCHHDTDHLVQLVQALCNSGVCPTAVYMDMDYTYNTQYTLDVLRRHKQALASLGVQLGLDIVNQCDTATGQTVNATPDGKSLFCLVRPGGSGASMTQEALLNVVMFFINNGIIDASTRLRIGGWTRNPVEQGINVNEGLGSTLAATANRVFNEVLLPARLANFPSQTYQPASGIIQPPGFFQVKSSGIFVSNGRDAYCGVSNWADFLALGGKPDLSNVAHPGSFPNGMRADPICPR